MTEYERGWLIGILEGEGCFGVMKSGRNRYAQIQFGTTDEDVVRRTHRLLGATAKIVHRRQQRKTEHRRIYAFTVTGVRALQIMRQIHPYMGDRRATRIKQILTQIEEEQMLRAA